MPGLFGGESWSQTYSYDRYGNRWVTAAGLATDPRTPDSSSDINPANNRLTGENYAYDLAGNQTTYGGWTLSYDAENRVKTSQQSGGYETAYVYDGDGRRVKKTTNGESTWFAYDAMGNLAAEYKATPPSGPALTHFITTDHLGSTRLVTDENGNVYSRHDYLPFGEEIFAGTGGRTEAMKYVPNDLLTPRFTGKERDTETGLDYFGARYFSGAQGRFLGVDPLSSSADRQNPQTLHRFVYGLNNPMVYVDVDGKWPFYVHNQIYTHAFRELLNQDQLNVVMRASWDADFGHGAQDPGNSYRHSMCTPGQGTTACSVAISSYTEEKLKIAGDLSGHGARLSSSALMEFGHGVHALTDMGSPAHMGSNGPLTWGNGKREGLIHILGERSGAVNWFMLGQSIRLAVAGFASAFPKAVEGKDLGAIANRAITKYVDSHYWRPGAFAYQSPIIMDAARQCALGNPAACR